MTLTLKPLDVAISMVFFTRLPLPRFDAPGRRLGEAIWAAPVAGLVVALLVWLVTLAADFVGLPSLTVAALALAAALLFTGCLHEDGLADVADGFGGGKTVERKLEIMHDSRLGTYGAAALFSVLLLRWSSLVTLLQHDAILPGLIAAHVGSRAIFARLLRDTPLAADSGLAAAVGPVPDSSAWLSLAIGLAALLLLGGFGAFLTVILLVAVILAFRQLCLSQIRGFNGDALGAAQQIAEATILLAAAAVLT